MPKVKFKKKHKLGDLTFQKDGLALIDPASAKRLAADGIVTILDKDKGLRQHQAELQRSASKDSPAADLKESSGPGK